VLSGGDAHTYMIPQDAVDVKLSPFYIVGEQFKDLEYVVEMEVFLFARGFINKNNFVLARGYSGNGTVAGDSSLQSLTSLDMVIPSAMVSGSQAYTAYTRTPYQGDPYMTRDGETLQPADYEHRYGIVSTSNAFELTKPIQQFYNDNTQTPEHVNCRTLEVLAVQDFWTTLGTGKIGGLYKENTLLDTGSLQSGSKTPLTATQNSKQPMVRTFSSGQQPYNNDYGMCKIVITDNTSLSATFTITVNANTISSQLISKGVDANTTAQNIASGFATESKSLGVNFVQENNVVYVYNLIPGHSHNKIVLSTSTGIKVVTPTGNFMSGVITGKDIPVNAIRHNNVSTPIKLTGCTERLPLGILMQDADFIGEDVIRTGQTLGFKSSGSPASELGLPLDSNVKGFSRLGSQGFMGMADGGTLRYTPYVQGVTDTGSKRYRVFRGGSVYNLSTEQEAGAPIDFGMGGFSPNEQPVLKGSVLAGRAYLVRNYKETAFTGSVTRTYGDELQMVVVTTGVTGNGVNCPNGYALQGIISPTGYGEGYSASDRYRLEGKPMYQKGSEKGPNCDVFIAPFPGTDPTDDPCA